MRIHFPHPSSRIPLIACAILAVTPKPKPTKSTLQAQEYAGVYISSPDEDYFTPCGVELTGNTWSLRFRDNDPHAPFLKKVTAMRGLAPLTHFIRVRGRLGPPGKYNVGFQTRELAVDTVLDVKETLEPCAGFGAPAVLDKMPAVFRDSKSFALSNDRRFVAVMDRDARISIWSTETGALVRKLGSVTKGNISAASYGPMAFSDDAKLIAVGGNDAIVRVWRPSDGKRVFALKLKDSADVAKERAKIPVNPNVWIPPLPPNSYAATRELVFNKRGTMLATTNLFSTRIWSMKTGKKLAEFDRGNEPFTKLFFVGEEGLLMTGDSGRMKMRSYLGAAPVSRPGTRAHATEHMAQSPDGRLFAIQGWGDSVFLWSLANGPGPVIPVPSFVSGAIAFSPDGKIVATAGGQAALYLWDTRTGAPIRAFYNFPGALSGVWFSADSKSIITLSHFDERFRIVYVDSSLRATEKMFDDSLTAQLPLGPPPSTAPRTVGGIVTGPNQRAVPGAEVEIRNGDVPDSVVERATTSSGGYFSFNGIRFRHVVFRVRKPGFAPGVQYVHLSRWTDDGPWAVVLKPETATADSASH